MEKEESAIDKIYKMEEELKGIKQYLQLIDNNLKLVLNRLNKIAKNTEISDKKTMSQITVTPGTIPAPKPKEIEDTGNIKTFGYIVNKNKEPILGADVVIYNDKNEIAKKRKTDESGYWEVKLSPGKYGVEYILSGYKPVNRNITLEKSAKEYEVK